MSALFVCHSAYSARCLTDLCPYLVTVDLGTDIQSRKAYQLASRRVVSRLAMHLGQHLTGSIHNESLGLAWRVYCCCRQLSIIQFQTRPIVPWQAADWAEAPRVNGSVLSYLPRCSCERRLEPGVRTASWTRYLPIRPQRAYTASSSRGKLSAQRHVLWLNSAAPSSTSQSLMCTQCGHQRAAGCALRPHISTT